MRHTSNSRSPYMARPSHKVLLTTRIAPLIPSFVALSRVVANQKW